MDNFYFFNNKYYCLFIVPIIFIILIIHLTCSTHNKKLINKEKFNNSRKLNKEYVSPIKSSILDNYRGDNDFKYDITKKKSYKDINYITAEEYYDNVYGSGLTSPKSNQLVAKSNDIKSTNITNKFCKEQNTWIPSNYGEYNESVPFDSMQYDVVLFDRYNDNIVFNPYNWVFNYYCV